MRLCAALLLVAFGTASLSAEFPSVMAERNLEKRSELALKEADRVIETAKRGYDENQLDIFKARINEVTELVDLSYKSLVDTGKQARRSPKYWKRAELTMRTLMRRLDSMAAAVSVDDRDVVITARKHVSNLHDQIVHDIMTKK